MCDLSNLIGEGLLTYLITLVACSFQARLTLPAFPAVVMPVLGKDALSTSCLSWPITGNFVCTPSNVQAVTEEERQAVVASYLDSLLTAQIQAREAAQKRLKDLYM